MNNATQNFAINNDFVAFRQGEYSAYSVNERAGEFLLNEESDLSKATLKEIADANKLTVSSKLNKSDYLSEVLNQLSEKDIPTMDQKPQSELVKDVVLEGHEEGLDDDAMLIKIVESGVKFSAAMKLFRKAQEELGLRMTAKGRNEFVNEILGDDFSPETPEEMAAAIDKIAEHDAISEAQARAAVRKYLKDNEREIPKAVQKAAAGGIRGAIIDFLVSNPKATTDELKALIREHQPDEEKAQRMDRWSAQYHILASRIANSLES